MIIGLLAVGTNACSNTSASPTFPLENAKIKMWITLSNHPDAQQVTTLTSAQTAQARLWAMGMSRDSGATWQPVKDYKVYGPVRISPHDSNVIFLAHRDGLYRSTDGLMTAKKVLDSEDNFGYRVFSFRPEHRLCGWKGAAHLQEHRWRGYFYPEGRPAEVHHGA